MSFRRQLFLSLAVLVLVPAAIAALAIGRVVTANENGKADARLQAASRVSGVIENDINRRASRRAEQLQNDPQLRAALRTARPSIIREALAMSTRRAGLIAASARFPDGRTVTVGDTPAVGLARVRAPLGPSGDQELTLTFASQRGQDYVDEVIGTGGVPVALVATGGSVLATSSGFPSSAIDLRRDPPKPRGRWRTVEAPVEILDGSSSAQAVFALNPTGGTSPLASRLVLGVLAAFILVGVSLGVVLVRALRWRIEQFAGAAEKLGAGDFSAASQIPARGNDEFAALGRAFIGMAHQLDQRVIQLEEERERVQSSLLRLGKAFAANLDRDTLIELVVESAVDGLTADAGRAQMPTAGGNETETRGSFGAVLNAWEVLGAVEQQALATGRAASASIGALHAIAEPIQVERDDDGPLGVISVARSRPFEPAERDLLAYLTEQATVSLRNVGRHEDVARESITDELTGLANRRRFDDVLAHAAARATPQEPIALVMLDLDRFKVINDTHGHPFGDQVLKAVARVVRDTARERDLPARYGGEELAVVLAKGDTVAARHFAERLRLAISALQLGDEHTGSVPVTASLGVASLPADGDDVGDLVRAADEALYRAKRGGRNRVEAATPPKGTTGEVR